MRVTLDEIEEWGMQHEKMKNLDCRWEAPPNAENMHVPGSAKPFMRGKGKAAAAAVSVRSEGEHVAEAAGEWQTAAGKKGEKKGKGNENNTARTSIGEQLASTVQTNSQQYGTAAKENPRPLHIE